MNINSVSGASSGRPSGWLWAKGPLVHRTAAGVPGFSGDDVRDTVTLSTVHGEGTAGLKEPMTLPDVLKVAVERLESGAEVVTLYDPQTGAVIAQMPPEQVIRALEEVLRANEGRRFS